MELLLPAKFSGRIAATWRVSLTATNYYYYYRDPSSDYYCAWRPAGKRFEFFELGFSDFPDGSLTRRFQFCWFNDDGCLKHWTSTRKFYSLKAICGEWNFWYFSEVAKNVFSYFSTYELTLTFEFSRSVSNFFLLITIRKIQFGVHKDGFNYFKTFLRILLALNTYSFSCTVVHHSHRKRCKPHNKYYTPYHNWLQS